MSPVARARGSVPTVQPEGLWTRIWRPFWVLPMVISLGAAILGFLLPTLEKGISEHLPYVFEGGPDGARSMLSTIASAMISVTGLVFSITIVALQLASSQFTPRVLGTFLGNRVTQWTLGVFVASFVFALTVLRAVRGTVDGSPAFVPQVSITVAFLLVIASVGFFLAFIHDITGSIQVSTVVARIGDASLRVADGLYPVETRPEPITPGPTWSPSPGTPRVHVDTVDRHGSVAGVDYGRLVSVARRLDAVITVDVTVGDFVPQSYTVLRVWGVDDLDEGAHSDLQESLRLASERSLRQDAAFGIRQLVDIAERALSPGINDPTTAVQVVDQLHRILRVLVQRESPSPYVTDDEGRVRVVHRPQRVEDLLHLAVAEIAHYGRDSLQVGPRLTTMLADLGEVALPRYQGTVAELTALVDRG